MVEYAVLLAGTTLSSLGTYAQAAQLWLSRLNWELIGYAILFLVVLKIVGWAFQTR